MAEEIKKEKKPRVSKKAGAGTQLSVEEKQKTVAEPVEKGEKTEAAAKKQAPKTAKTASAKSGAKKTPVKKEKTEEGLAKEQPTLSAGEAPKKGSKKQKESATEQKAEKVKAEAVAAQEVKPEEEKARKSEEKPKKASPAKKKAKPAAAEAKAEEKKEEAPLVEKAEAPLEAEAQPVQTVEKKEAKRSAKKAVPAEKKPDEKKPAEKKQAEKPALTKAEKRDFVKKLVRESLVGECKWSDLVDRVAQGYKDAYPIPENDNLNDVKGRVGSVLHLMQEEGEISIEGNLVKSTVAAQKTEKEDTVSVVNAENESAPAASETQEAPAEKQSVAVQKVEVSAPAPLYDLSVLFDKKKPAKKAAEKSVNELAQEKAEEQAKTGSASKVQDVAIERSEKTDVLPLAEKKSVPVKGEKAAVPSKKQEEKPAPAPKKEVPTRRPTRLAKADPLKDSFLKKLRSLGGNYFEYYAVYLLERYSRMNGRRLEGLRISGGEYDGGIDGELELTDRLGFRETIYVQAKNWEPTDEKWWIGETLLQQFIGAVAYRQAKEGKQHCRGIYVTTSAFTTGAKEILDKMSDKFVGYDGDDLYETAKECRFGLIQDDKGNWKVDDELLSGKKSFFFMV